MTKRELNKIHTAKDIRNSDDFWQYIQHLSNLSLFNLVKTKNYDMIERSLRFERLLKIWKECNHD